VKTNAGADTIGKLKNRIEARVRAKVECPYRILKLIFGPTKVLHRGLKKHPEWPCLGLALVNFYQNRKRLAQLKKGLAPRWA